MRDNQQKAECILCERPRLLLSGAVVLRSRASTDDVTSDKPIIPRMDSRWMISASSTMHFNQAEFLSTKVVMSRL